MWFESDELVIKENINIISNMIKYSNYGLYSFVGVLFLINIIV